MLALDLSGRTGWAYGSGPIPDLYHFRDFPQHDRGQRLNAFRSWLNDMLEQWQPCRVVMEAPLHLRAQRDAPSARQQYGLAAYCEGECAEQGIPCKEMDVDDVRRRVIGRTRLSRVRPGTVRADLFGRAVPQSMKDMVVAHVRSLGLPVADHNVADAICLYLAVRSEDAAGRITRHRRLAA